MFRLATRCGREITVTGIIISGCSGTAVPALIRSEEARACDFLPVPDIVTGVREHVRSIDILPYLSGSNLSVFAEEPVVDFVAATGTDAFAMAMQEVGISRDRN